MMDRSEALDAGTRSTDGFAAHARVSTLRKGYIQDEFLQFMVPRHKTLPTHAPLIHIGTYHRSESIDRLVHDFLEAGGRSKKQVVSLGAGSDTRFWRLASGPYRDTIAAYVELDFAENTAKKCMTIRKSKELSGVLGDDVKTLMGGLGLSSSLYHLLPVDLRESPGLSLSTLIQSLAESTAPILQADVPTLFLAECVLVYMTLEESSAVLQWFSSRFQTTAGVIYEMYSLDDPFGRVMRQNLKLRDVELPGANAFPNLPSVEARFTSNGFDMATAVSLKSIRTDYTPEGELQRIAKLELVDEYEELDLVLAHYALAWGLKLDKSSDPSLQRDLGVWGLHKYSNGEIVTETPKQKRDNDLV